MSHRSHSSRILQFVSMGALFGALAFATGCGTHKYLNFQVWEGPGQVSEAHKSFDADIAIGSYHDQVWELLGKNDVDGAIKLIEAEQQKSHFDYYNLDPVRSEAQLGEGRGEHQPGHQGRQGHGRPVQGRAGVHPGPQGQVRRPRRAACSAARPPADADPQVATNSTPARTALPWTLPSNDPHAQAHPFIEPAWVTLSPR